MSDQTGARDILDEIRALNDERQAELAQLLQPHIQGGLGRRELLQGAGTLGVAGLLGLGGGAAVGTARADASDSDSDGDVGEPGNPVDAWFDGISADGSIITVDDGGWALAHSTPSSATTSSGEQFVFGDTTIAAFPYTLATADLVPGHAKRIHCNGGNTLTVNTQGSATIDGQPSLELEDGQQVIVYTDGSNWFTNLAFPSIATGEADITGRLSFPIENGSDVTSSRSIDGWFTNNTGDALFVMVAVRVSPSSGTSFVRVVGHVNNSAQTTSNTTVRDVSPAIGDADTNGDGAVSFIVPDGANYRIEQFGDTGDSSLSLWTESQAT